MGKLNIAHHKSYHPYRQDNIARVRRDEEEARLKEQVDEGRMLLAVSIINHECLHSVSNINQRMQNLVFNFCGLEQDSLLVIKKL